jgi:glutamine synthetase type III
VDALPELISKESVAAFEKQGAERASCARYDIMVETCYKTVNVEGS